MTDGMKRNGIEMGVVITAGIFMIGLSFNAGIQYARINEVSSQQQRLSAEYDQLFASETPIQVRLDHIETMLSVIQQEAQHQDMQKRNENDPPPK